MAEFFAECVKQIRVRLGPTDSELDEKLNFLTPATKKCVLDNSFGVSVASFAFKSVLEMPFSDYLNLLYKYFECTSFSEVDNFNEIGEPKFPLTDDDVDLLSSRAPKLKTVTFYVVAKANFTDRAVEYLSERCNNLQQVRLYWACEKLTDATLFALSKMENLLRISVVNAPLMTDAGMNAICKLRLDELSITGTSNITDAGVENMPDSLIYLIMTTPKVTPPGFKKMLQTTGSKMVTLEFGSAVLDEDCIIEVFKKCPHICRIDVRKTPVSEKLFHTVPVPPALERIVLPKGTNPPKPAGTKAQVFWPS
jgi:hypothetical protein